MRQRISVLVVLLAFSTFASAGVPDWLRAAARENVSGYKPDTDAVILLHEEVTSVDNNGDFHTIYREAVRILRPNRRDDLSTIPVHFDNETKITWMKGWAITASGQEYEVKEKDAIETNTSTYELVTDQKVKVLPIPGAAVGATIGYEYQQRRRPSIYEDIWMFQRELPVKVSRYSLHLPAGWEYETFWDNHAKVEPTANGTDYMWQINDIPPVETEDYMPPMRAIAGRMLLHFYGQNARQSSGPNWGRVGSWYSQLVADRRSATPEIQAQVKSITVDSKTQLEKMAAIASWVQKNIRYFAVEIGIGGYQPHYPADIYRTRYGDCKDKVTLVATMLKEVGVDTDYVLIHSTRGYVRANSPSAITFNHVIAAIHLPKDITDPSLRAVYNDPKLGRLLLFDPTDDMTPFGYLPSSLQQTNALLVAGNEGQLIQTPLLAPVSNELRRQGKLKVDANGKLSGHVDEIRSGLIGRDFRELLLASESKDRSKAIERILGSTLASFELNKAQVGNMENISDPLMLFYDFSAQDYAKKAGSLLLVRPRVLGQKHWSILEGKARLYPVEYDNATVQTDAFDIDIPDGYEVDELPDPVDVSFDFAEYHSKVENAGKTLKYTRRYTIKQVIVPTDRLDDLKKFYRAIASDERNTAVLKQKAGSAGQ